MIDGERAGPCTPEEMKGKLAAGEITGQTLVWREGMTDWLPLERAVPRRPGAAPPLEPRPAFAPVTPPVRCPGCGEPCAPEFMQPVLGTLHCASCAPAALASRYGNHRLGAGPSGARAAAGFWIRVPAKLIDGGVVFCLMTLVAILFWPEHSLVGALQRGMAAGAAGGRWAMPRAPLGMNLTMLAVDLLYNASLIAAAGGTLGKLLFGLEVADEMNDRCGFLRALWRTLCERISACLCFTGYLMVPFTERNRGLHDMLAGTRVVHGQPA